MTDLDAMLAEWAKWCRQGTRVAAGYPARCPVERYALPYKIKVYEDDELGAMEAARDADERTGRLVEMWVGQLEMGPQATLRTTWVYEPAADYLDPQTLAIKRAAECAKRLRAAGMSLAFLSLERYDQWYGEGYADLRWMHGKWTGGV
jgi:hypothetical protein